ncbi:MAG TPA: hypothetical protein VFH95_13590 [Candidatus Kapabacteria bacterium]|nr:hypothetical protein [Candidatus Kapabacteria bacterium]
MKLAATLVLIASFLSILFGVLGYPVIGHDAYVHLNWLYQFPRLFSQGTGYPRWLPDSFGGFGAPTFYFYAPLVYWIASVFHLLGVNSPSLLYQVVQLAFSLLSLFTCYRLIRQFHAPKMAALIGALSYSFLAYHFCDVYIRDALTEHVALAFLPIVFLRFPNRIRSIAFYAIGWTGLFLTNLPIAYIAVISVVIISFARRSYHEFPLQAVSFIIAIAVSAIYLFPAFALRSLIHQRHLFDLPMHTSQFGFALLDIFQGHFDWLRILSIATILAGLLCFVILIRNSDKESRAWKWLIAVAIFFQIPFISAPLWHLIPGMPFVQFSWRWNGVLLLAIVCSGAVPAPSRTMPIYLCAIIGLATVTLLCEFTISRNLFTRPPLPINSYLMDAPEYAPKWASSDPAEVIGITLRRMDDPPAVLLGLTMPGDSISLRSKSPIESHFIVHLDRATPVRFHQFYWPYWKAFADTLELSLRPDPNGFATALLPAGNSIITLKLVESPIEKIGSTVSSFGLSVLFVLCALAAYRAITMRRETVSPLELTLKI